MFNLLRSTNVPVNLIRQPIERGVMLVWLIAIAQFFSYSVSNEVTLTAGWILTAPALMIASLLIAMRSQNSLPLTVSYASGIVAVLFYMHGDLSSAALWQDSFRVNLSLMSISVYTLLFWMFSRYFLHSRYFQTLQRLICLDHNDAATGVKFRTSLFYLSFIILNSSIVLSLIHPGHFALVNLVTASVFLFIAGQSVSGTMRGVLLPVYVTLILKILLISTFVSDNFVSGYPILNNSTIVFVFWALLLWSGHNFIAPYYNKIFPGLKITTTLWPWFGLLLLVIITLEQAPEIFFDSFYLLILLVYLFLMLRNTTMPLISWSIVLLVSWLFLVVLSFINPMTLSLKYLSQLGYYGVYSFYFSFALLVFAVLWERYFNPYIMQFGWQKLSFTKPALTISVIISMLWLIINMVLATGLISGWFNLIHEGLFIEKTTLLLVVSFIALYLFIKNILLANLIHFSMILLLIVLWGFNKPVPVYTLFALIHLIWVMLPLVPDELMNRLSSTSRQQLIASSANWIYVSFVAAIVSLFYLADSYAVGMDSLVFIFSIAILFIAAIVMARRYTQQLWIVFSYLLATGLMLSLRFMLMGTVAPNAFDTAAILSISLLLYIVNQYGYLPSPIISSDTLVKLFPLTALFTLSWQTGSLHSSVTLFILGLFYLFYEKDNRFLVYSGFALMNLAIYLWIPLLSSYSGLLLFYIAPVSLSLLLISHLHRDEIKPGMNNKIRFIALSTLYVVVTADVFINETLYVFTLALLLGLASVIYGISSRTRAFLYTGISFLVINILAQLVLLYPDGRLGRALILMTTGALITGTMIWFNIKREMLLSKMRLFRTNLDSWD